MVVLLLFEGLEEGQLNCSFSSYTSVVNTEAIDSEMVGG